MPIRFTHTDYTEELNRIITAMTGIRNDIRLLRRTLEDPEQDLSALLTEYYVKLDKGQD